MRLVDELSVKKDIQILNQKSAVDNFFTFGFTKGTSGRVNDFVRREVRISVVIQIIFLPEL